MDSLKAIFKVCLANFFVRDTEVVEATWSKRLPEGTGVGC